MSAKPVIKLWETKWVQEPGQNLLSVSLSHLYTVPAQIHHNLLQLVVGHWEDMQLGKHLPNKSNQIKSNQINIRFIFKSLICRVSIFPDHSISILEMEWSGNLLRKPEFRDNSGIYGNRKISVLRNGNRKISSFHFVNRKNFRFPFRKQEIFTVYVT